MSIYNYIYIYTYITISQTYLWYESICMHTHVSITNPTFVTHDLDLSARQEVSEQHRVLHHQEAAHSCQKMTSFGVPAGCGPSKCLNQPIIAVGPAIFARTWAVLLDLARLCKCVADTHIGILWYTDICHAGLCRRDEVHSVTGMAVLGSRRWTHHEDF